MNRKNLWAPWRINYIREIEKTDECFICRSCASSDDDAKNLLLWRTQLSVVILNLYPYNNGHLLIAPLRHIPDLDSANDDELLELMKLVRQCRKLLSLAIEPHGFNIGINLGRCAGAGLPGHLHIHVVPRWNGDTNFINVCSDTDVISQSLTELWQLLKQTSEQNNLPGL